MRLLLAAKKNQATRRNEIMKSYLQLGLSSNKIIHKTASSKDPILGLENLLKTGFAQKDTAPRLLWPTFLVFRTCKHHDSTGPETKQENKKMDQQNNNHTQTKQKTRQSERPAIFFDRCPCVSAGRDVLRLTRVPRHDRRQTSSYLRSMSKGSNTVQCGKSSVNSFKQDSLCLICHNFELQTGYLALHQCLQSSVIHPI